MAYLNAKNKELKTNCENKNIVDFYRGINEFKKGYSPRTNIVKGEKANLITDRHSILARWRKHFSQLQNVFDVRQTETHTSELLVPQPNAFDFEMAIETMKRHKSPNFNQIPPEIIKSSGRTIRSEIYKIINSIWNNE
jgi:hypothetical protein